MNKNQILKIAKVKNINEFYRKYPTEEVFMAKHGGAFKKAAMGAAMVNKQLTQLTDFSNPPQAQSGWHAEWNQDPYAQYEGTDDAEAVYLAEVDARNVAQNQMKTSPINAPKSSAAAKKPASNNYSVVDFMSSKGLKSDFNTRKGLAQQYGIKDYKGTAEQNMQLLSHLKGKSVAPKTETAKKTEAAKKTASAAAQPVKPKLSAAEQYIADDPYFFAEESDPNWIKALDAPFSGLRNLGARVVLDQDPKAALKLAAMGALGGVGRMLLKGTEELYPYNPNQIGAPPPKQISNYGPVPRQIGGRPAPTGWSTQNGMRSGQYPIREYGGDIPQAYDGINIDPITGQVISPRGMVSMDDTQALGMQDYGAKGLGAVGNKSNGLSNLKGMFSTESPDNVWGGVKNVIQGGMQMKEDRNNYLRTRQWGKIADLVGQSRKDERIKNKYDFPWDRPFDPNQLSRSYGTGYDVLASAQDGMEIGGNPTEIQNMYTNEDTIYSDLGYEPLQDSVKQYQTGGMFPNWQSDLTKFGSQNSGTLGGGFGSFVGGGGGHTSGTSTMLSGVGQLAGTAIGGPLGGAIGSFAGGALGGLFGAAEEKRMQQAQNKIASLGGTQDIFNFQNQNHGIFQDGGEVGLKYLSHDWQPQVITKFGDYDVNDLFAPDPTMDTLRAGGNVGQVPYTPASARAMSTERPHRYDMGGDVQVDGRGELEVQGYNPVTAASGANGNIGITRGPSHDNGGFNVQRGNNVVEVEGGETALYKADDGASIDPQTGQPEQDFLILGDMNTGDLGNFIGQDVNESTLKKVTKGKDIKNMKFKHLGNNVAKLTGNLNKKENKFLNLIDSGDRLKDSTARVGLEGIGMQYKDLHSIQNDLMAYQEAYHSAAKDHGYDDTPKFLKDLKQGKLKDNMANFGAKMETAQFGFNLYGEAAQPPAQYMYGPGQAIPQYQKTPPATKSTYKAYTSEPREITNLANATDTDLKDLYAKAKAQGRGKAVSDFQKAFHAKYPDLAKSIIGEEKYGVTNLGKSKSLTKADLASNEDAIFGPRTERYMAAIRNAQRVQGPGMSKKTTPTPPNITAKVPDIAPLNQTAPVKDKTKLADLYNMFSPYFKPLIKNPLDPRQLAGEMYGLSHNQLEGVKAQGYQPYLETPYSVSYQDQLNANQADFNAMQRQLGSNPSALATLAGQKYAANAGVLGQQARANQELQMGAYNRNRATLNDAALKNLAIYDQQAEKQARAKSLTKAQDYEYLRSMGDKYARARGEELAANVQANMYPDYTFGPKGRIYNTGIANFSIPEAAGADPEFVKLYSDYLEKKSGKSKSTKVKNGGIVKEYKKL